MRTIGRHGFLALFVSAVGTTVALGAKAFARMPIQLGQCSGISVSRVAGERGVPLWDSFYLRVAHTDDRGLLFYPLEEGRQLHMAAGERADWLKFSLRGEHESYPVRLMTDRRPFPEFGRPPCARNNATYGGRRSGHDALPMNSAPFA
jgi:hypothetical protein